MIDTISLKYKRVPTQEEKQRLVDSGFIIAKNTKYEEVENKSIICLKPAKIGTSNLEETIEVKKSIDTIIGESGEIMRVDVALDREELFKDKIQLYRLFISCLNIERGKTIEDVYNTNRWLEIKNVKTRKNNYETVVYDCSDKINRLGNTRIENRALYIRSGLSDREKLEKELLKYNKELDQILKKNKDTENSLIGIVEKFMTRMLVEEYKSPKMNIQYVGVRQFVDHLDRLGLVMTKGILEKTLKGIGYKGSTTNFIREYRRIRKGGLNFATRTELEKLIREIKKENKRTLEG